MASSESKKTRDKSCGETSYPEPYVVLPHAEHKQSIILLHGRGSNGEKFGQELLQSRVSGGEGPTPATFQTVFQNMKFIFPTAKKRRARWYKRATINQWFDGVPINEQDIHAMSREEEEWQLEGLKQSRKFLKEVVDEEVRLLGAENVFIGGLSQGCAMGLHLLLSYKDFGGDLEKEAHLGGFVGMSGWLPFAKDVERILRAQGSEGQDANEDEDESDPFAAKPGPDYSPLPVAAQVCNHIRDNMDLSPITGSDQPLSLHTPVFLGHGTNDEKVKIAKGRQVAEVLRMLGARDIRWKEYDEGHWYKAPEELDDIIEFLKSRPA